MSRFVRHRTLMIVGLLIALLAAPGSFFVRASDPGSETLDTLIKNTVPVRDQFDLARRLLGIKVLSPTPTAAKTYEVGDQESFSAVDNDQNRDFMLNAQLWYKTPHVYMWFQIGFRPDPDAVKQSAENFENKIYPTVHEYFGSEQSPGVDNDV